MSEEKPLTTADVARYCRVSQVTVWKWIKQGRLKAYRMARGPYYIEKGALRSFLQERGWPIKAEFFAKSAYHVLVVDDEPTTVEVVVRTLQRLGEKVKLATAHDGFEAGLQVATFKPDLLILDLMMPQINGFEVCRHIRHNPATAHLKILILTAFGSHENIQRALQLGADDFIHKPLDIHQLTAKVRALLAWPEQPKG